MAIKFYVDWNKNENFTGTYDDITADVIEAEWFLGARSPFQSTCDELTLRLTLKNTTGKYSPENTGSVIAGLVRPYCRVRVVDDATSTPMWNGYLDFPTISWQPMGTFTGKGQIILQAIGAKGLLERITVILPEYASTTGNEIIEDVLELSRVFLIILDAWLIGVAGFSELGVTTVLQTNDKWRTFDEGLTTFEDFGGGRENAWSVIADVAQTERGYFYIDRTGRYIFKNRLHTYLSDTVGTAKSKTGTGGIDYTYGDLMVNLVTVTGVPKRTSSSELLWTLPAPLSVSPSSTIVIDAKLRRSTGQFASATALTEAVTYSQGDANITVTPNGGIAKITIGNTGKVTAIINTMTLTGSPSVEQNQLVVQADDIASQALYGKREKSFSLNNVSEYRVVLYTAHMELLRLPMRGRVTSITMRREDGGANHADVVTGLKIGDFVEADFNDTVYHTGRYVVIGEQHAWQAPNVHEATFFFEPVVQTGFVLDVAGRNELNGAKTVLIY